ncbi:MAG TPA: hypothetical protein VM936_21460 [Pyrinomonadaceae bacterium]|jgi:hypothetical protein|nr:hypothetical protein [Pyrinomonadaceae bacterium]
MNAKAVALFATLALCGCAPARPSAAAETPRESRPAATPRTGDADRGEGAAEGTTVEDFIKASPFEERAKLLRAWAREPGRDRYRLARADDFAIADAVKRLYYWPDLKTALGAPYQYGEFNGSGGGGLVVLVADGTKAAPERFGVVLFVDGRAKGYELHWLFRDADFSPGFTVQRHSGDVYLSMFDAAGGVKSCDIKRGGGPRKFVCRFF